ncbi:DNA cytosine methyltransferase [Aquitalea aquatica]|uniref:DNA cytosine methyltransferase n=1 Tax=Aquitalea aquatica TaxID=3044273 RepID=UPI00216361D0|nr:DNA (cytosine-5-)-methyltransferase [Aquitalea magnusonii]
MHGPHPTIGSLFAGIGGFDIGFENAGFTTAWQVEINPVCRAVLADHFPHARQFDDVRTVGAHNLSPVDVLVGGFPCQDLSTMGARQGLAGQRSGLFFEVCRLARELQPRWLVLENVMGLLSCRDGEDFQTVISTLAECGYVGCWRVLDASCFAVPAKRRSVFIIAGLLLLMVQPPLSCWLTPAQWQQFLARRQRNNPDSSLSLHYLPDKPPVRSLSMAQASLLKPTDGVRWLSGPERLAIMGFASDWMRPNCRGSSCRQRRCAASRGMDRPEAEGDLCVRG